jgi:hypothetical protein
MRGRVPEARRVTQGFFLRVDQLAAQLLDRRLRRGRPVEQSRVVMHARSRTVTSQDLLRLALVVSHGRKVGARAGHRVQGLRPGGYKSVRCAKTLASSQFCVISSLTKVQQKRTEMPGSGTPVLASWYVPVP